VAHYPPLYIANTLVVTRSIVGYKREESDVLLVRIPLHIANAGINVAQKFLYDHLAYGADFQTRVKWAPKTVVVWDNRVTAHSALVDWKNGQRRHLARIAPQAEAPVETPFKA
jgi:sulfonate dioxygenase